MFDKKNWITWVLIFVLIAIIGIIIAAMIRNMSDTPMQGSTGVYGDLVEYAFDQSDILH